MHNFKESLAKGKAGEALFLLHMPWLQKLGGRQSDFMDSRDGSLWELKCDSYDITRTSNMFIEFYSDITKQKPGGPTQALAHGSKFWAYYFIKNATCFIFQTKDLVEALPSLIKDLEPKYINNRGWTTMGYAVPRARLSHLYTEVHFE